MLLPPKLSCVFVAMSALVFASQAGGCIVFDKPPLQPSFGECAADGQIVLTGDPHPTEPCQVCGAALDFEPCLFGCNAASSTCNTPTVVSAGVDHTCALVGEGEIYCWGNNASGQVGNGTVGGVVMDVQKVELPLGARAEKVVAGPRFTCALTEFGQVFCWGGIDWINGFSNGPACIDIEEPSGSPILMSCIDNEGAALDVVLHEFGICAPIDGEYIGVFCLSYINTPPIPSETGLARFAVGDGVVCSLNKGGEVGCTGGGPLVGLGPDDDNAPAAVQLPAPAVGLSVGYGHACAWSDEGRVWCWGENSRGRIPQADLDVLVPPSSPVEVDVKARTLIAGRHHTCAVLADNPRAIRCWGDMPQAGIIDDETGYSEVTLPSEVMGIDGMADHVCAVDAKGVIWCWGANPDGRLGANYRFDSDTPKAVLIPNPAQPSL